MHRIKLAFAFLVAATVVGALLLSLDNGSESPDLFRLTAEAEPLAKKDDPMANSAWYGVELADFERASQRATQTKSKIQLTGGEFEAMPYNNGDCSDCETQILPTPNVMQPQPVMHPIGQPVTAAPPMVLQPITSMIPGPPNCRHCGSVAGKRGCKRCGHLANQLNKGIRPFKDNPGNCAECGVRRCITGVDSATCLNAGEPDWGMRQPVPFDLYGQGEYVGPARTRHVNKYRVRVDDQLVIVFRITRNRTSSAYELNVGDEVRVEAVADEDLDRRVIIQPDGTITLRLLGQVMAAGRTTDELRRDLEKRYEEFYNEPTVTVTPEKVNTKLDDLRATIDARQGIGGQQFQVTVAPDGTIQLPAIGSVPAHGLTLEELKMEIDARYNQVVRGLEATPVLQQRAPRFIYVVGEVTQPGRIELVGPTTVTQAIALAEGWNNGANLRNIVVFRRAEDWRLLATKIDIRGALYGRRPAPSDEIWLRDSDVVIVPKTPIRVLDDAIDLVFTQGIYAVAPFFSDPIIFTDASNL